MKEGECVMNEMKNDETRDETRDEASGGGDDRVLDVETALRLLAEIVNEVGADHVYEVSGFGTCKYLREGKPDCLIGRVLHRFGISDETLKMLDCATTSGTSLGAGDLHKHLPNVPYHTSVVLRAAQLPQDAGREWGRCLRDARTQAYVCRYVAWDDAWGERPRLAY